MYFWEYRVGRDKREKGYRADRGEIMAGTPRYGTKKETIEGADSRQRTFTGR